MADVHIPVVKKKVTNYYGSDVSAKRVDELTAIHATADGMFNHYFKPLLDEIKMIGQSAVAGSEFSPAFQNWVRNVLNYGSALTDPSMIQAFIKQFRASPR